MLSQLAIMTVLVASLNWPPCTYQSVDTICTKSEVKEIYHKIYEIPLDESIAFVSQMLHLKDYNPLKIYLHGDEFIYWLNGDRDKITSVDLNQMNMVRFFLIRDIIECRWGSLTKKEDKRKAVEVLFELLECKEYPFLIERCSGYGGATGNPPWQILKATILRTLAKIGNSSDIPRLKKDFITSPRPVLDAQFRKLITDFGGQITPQEMKQRKEWLKQRFPKDPNMWYR